MKSVIGWSWYDGDRFVGLPDDGFTLQVWNAVLSDVKENGYLFAGEDQQEFPNCCPVLDDYRIARFTRRGFARLMAEAHGETGDYDYARYMESSSIKEESKVFPNGRAKKDPRVRLLTTGSRCFDLTIDKSLFDQFLDLYVDQVDLSGEIVCIPKDSAEKSYLLPVAQKEEDPRFWFGDSLQFFDDEGNSFPIYLYIDKILAFSSYDEFADYCDRRRDSFDEEYVYDPDRIRQVCPKEILLLSVR